MFLEHNANATGVPELLRLRDLAYEDAQASNVLARESSTRKSPQRFTLEHVLSELALGGIGLAPTLGGGVKMHRCTERRVFNGHASISLASRKEPFPTTGQKPTPR